jgi:hypothetical protein
MPLDPTLSLLAAKMAAAATCVVLASLIAERTGPLVAAMVATLPVSAGPIYVFLALEHDATFIEEAALASISSNLATTAFCTVYVFAAQRLRTAGAIGSAFAGWAVSLLLLKAANLPFLAAVLLMLVAIPAAHHLSRPYLHASAVARGARPWYAIPLRAAGVATLVAVVTTISVWAGAQWSGFLATFPIVMSSLIVILQPGLGGKATAAVIANSLLGLLGFGIGLAALHLAAVPVGKWWALALGLAINVGWNVGMVAFARRR